MKSGSFRVCVWLVCAGLWSSQSPPSLAGVNIVSVYQSGFTPDSLTITRGESVTWVNDDETDDSHTTTSDLPIINFDYWNAILFNNGDFYSKAFNNLGTFTYHDTLGVGTGRIMVSEAATPIVLESPRIVAGQFLFDLTGLAIGKTNVLEFSTNLTNWASLQTNVAAGSSATRTNAMVTGQRFYRVFQLP